MRNGPSTRESSTKGLMQRLDRIAGDINVVLVVIALGLGTLDLTFLFTQKVIEHLPQVTRVVDDGGTTAAK